MSVAIDYEKMVRDACEGIVAHHVSTRLAQAGCRLVRGDAASCAKAIVRKWSAPTAKAFYLLATTKDRFLSKREVREAASVGESTWASFWGRLRGMKIEGAIHDTIERREIRLFRRGHELFWSGSGIKLSLNTEFLNFDLARKITNDTLAATVATAQNYRGAQNAQEAANDQSEEERTHAARKLDNALDESAAPKKQTDLFGTGS